MSFGSSSGVLIHEYVALDLDRGVEALRRLDPLRRFAALLAPS